MTVSQREAATTSASLWRNRNYLLLCGGQTLSDTGGAISELAFPLLVLSLTHSAAQAGFVAALRAAPALLLTLPAGALVDHLDRRHIMLACDVGRMLCLASIPIALALGRLSMGQLCVAAFLEGALAILFELAKTAMVAQIVEPLHYTSAATQDELLDGVTTLAGPSLSGALYALSALAPFLADAISYAVSVATLALMRVSPTIGRASPTWAPRDIWRDVSSGVSWVWRQPFILTMTLMMGAGAFVYPSATLITIILAQRAGAPAWEIGLIFTAGGVGLILGSWLASRLTRRLTVGQSILISRWFIALSWPLYALAPVPAMLVALDFGSGFVDPIEDVAYFSHRLRLIPDELRGRVISVCRLVPGVIRPLGLALTGILIQRMGVFPTIWLLFAWLLLATTLLTMVPYVRRERAAETGD